MPCECTPPLERARKEEGRKEGGWEEVEKDLLPSLQHLPPSGSVERPALAPWLRPEWGLGRYSSEGLGPGAPGVSSSDLGDSGEHQPDKPLTSGCSSTSPSCAHRRPTLPCLPAAGGAT